MGFSGNTILELIEALKFTSHAQIDSFVIRFQLQAADNHGSLERRPLGIVQHLIAHPETKGLFGANVVLEIIEYLIENHEQRHTSEDVNDAFPRLVRSLKRNGYLIKNGKLTTMLPEIAEIAETEDELRSLLDGFAFTIAKGHFAQAISAHSRGDWASANAQLRTFIEAMFDSIADKLAVDKTKLPADSNDRRKFLTALTPPFLLPDLNEWESTGKGFVQGLFKRLHPSGSHPGLSDEEDSTFRLHLVIIVASHYMRRLATYI